MTKISNPMHRPGAVLTSTQEVGEYLKHVREETPGVAKMNDAGSSELVQLLKDKDDTWLGMMLSGGAIAAGGVALSPTGVGLLGIGVGLGTAGLGAMVGLLSLPARAWIHLQSKSGKRDIQELGSFATSHVSLAEIEPIANFFNNEASRAEKMSVGHMLKELISQNPQKINYDAKKPIEKMIATAEALWQ